MELFKQMDIVIKCPSYIILPSILFFSYDVAEWKRGEGDLRSMIMLIYMTLVYVLLLLLLDNFAMILF